MTDEEHVLVSTGRWGEVYHQPLGTTTFPRCGRNAQQDVDFERVSRAEAEADYEQCQRCPFDAPEGDETLLADGGYASPPEVTVHSEGETITLGVDHGDISVVVQAPCYTAGYDLDEALEAAVREAHHVLSVHPKSNVSETPDSRDGDLLPDGGFDTRREPEGHATDAVPWTVDALARADPHRLRGLQIRARYRYDTADATHIEDEIVAVDDTGARRVLQTRPIREDGRLGTPVRTVPLDDELTILDVRDPGGER